MPHFFKKFYEALLAAPGSKPAESKSRLVRVGRIAIVFWRMFYSKPIQFGAALLTYYTLLGIVPSLVILLGIARGFSQENLVINALLERFISQREIVEQLIDYAKASLGTLTNGFFSAIGVVILLFSFIRILGGLESTFNEIWKVERARSPIRQFTDYLAMVLFSPLVFILATLLTFYVSAKIVGIGSPQSVTYTISPVLFLFYNCISFLLTAFLFTFLYMFMPNTRVYFKPALLAGLLASALYQIVQIIYLTLQTNLSAHSAILGTFAAIPLFLAWLRMSWVVLLMGSEVAFVLQNGHAFELISKRLKLTHHYKLILAIRIVHFYSEQFLSKKPPANTATVSDTLGLPHFLTMQIINLLLDAKLLCEVKKNDDTVGYQMNSDPTALTITDVIEIVESQGYEIALPRTKEYKEITERLNKFSSHIKKLPANCLLSDL